MRFSNCWLLILFFLAFCIPVGAQSTQEQAKPSLEATTYLLEQNDCITDSDVGGDGEKVKKVRVGLVLKVIYKNNGSTPIIIHQGSGRVSGRMIAFSVEDARRLAYPYEDSIQDSSFFYEDDDGKIVDLAKTDSDTPSSAFVVISPDDFYESRSNTDLLISLSEGYRPYEDRVCQLQLELGTVDWERARSNKLEEARERWKQYGYLWTENITSEPMSIRFPSISKLGNCNPK